MKSTDRTHSKASLSGILINVSHSSVMRQNFLRISSVQWQPFISHTESCVFSACPHCKRIWHKVEFKVALTAIPQKNSQAPTVFAHFGRHLRRREINPTLSRRRGTTWGNAPHRDINEYYWQRSERYSHNESRSTLTILVFIQFMSYMVFQTVDPIPAVGREINEMGHDRKKNKTKIRK